MDWRLNSRTTSSRSKRMARFYKRSLRFLRCRPTNLLINALISSLDRGCDHRDVSSDRRVHWQHCPRPADPNWYEWTLENVHLYSEYVRHVLNRPNQQSGVLQRDNSLKDRRVSQCKLIEVEFESQPTIKSRLHRSMNAIEGGLHTIPVRCRIVSMLLYDDIREEFPREEFIGRVTDMKSKDCMWSWRFVVHLRCTGMSNARSFLQ